MFPPGGFYSIHETMKHIGATEDEWGSKRHPDDMIKKYVSVRLDEIGSVDGPQTAGKLL